MTNPTLAERLERMQKFVEEQREHYRFMASLGCASAETNRSEMVAVDAHLADIKAVREGLEELTNWATIQSELEDEHPSPHHSASAGYASAVGDVLAIIKRTTE